MSECCGFLSAPGILQMFKVDTLKLSCSLRQSRKQAAPRRLFASATPPPSSSPPSDKPISSVESVIPLASAVEVTSTVQKGFGRGSKQIGVPTANMNAEHLEALRDVSNGVYCGWAQVHVPNDARFDGVYKAVLNLGASPTFADVQGRLVEAHILHNPYPDDFYGASMRVCITGFLRNEMKFNGFPQLLMNIKNDIQVADTILDRPEMRKYQVSKPL